LKVNAEVLKTPNTGVIDGKPNKDNEYGV